MSSATEVSQQEGEPQVAQRRKRPYNLKRDRKGLLCGCLLVLQWMGWRDCFCSVRHPRTLLFFFCSSTPTAPLRVYHPTSPPLVAVSVTTSVVFLVGARACSPCSVKLADFFLLKLFVCSPPPPPPFCNPPPSLHLRSNGARNMHSHWQATTHPTASQTGPLVNICDFLWDWRGGSSLLVVSPLTNHPPSSSPSPTVALMFFPFCTERSDI